MLHDQLVLNVEIEGGWSCLFFNLNDFRFGDLKWCGLIHGIEKNAMLDRRQQNDVEYGDIIW